MSAHFVVFFFFWGGGGVMCSGHAAGFRKQRHGAKVG